MNARYGIDAPGVAINLFLFSTLAFAVMILSFLIPKPILSWIVFIYGAVMGFSLAISALWMIYSSKVLKPKIAKEIIDHLDLKKTDTVLDLGCGRGLFLILAAKKAGKAFGIDLWQTKDQSGNAPEKTLQNAKIEGVDVELQTADMRSLPFPDETFDAIVTSLAIHNIPNPEGRKQALSEMIRTLKPGGKFSIFDIQYGEQYAANLKDSQEILVHKKIFSYCPPITLIYGRKKV